MRKTNDAFVFAHALFKLKVVDLKIERNVVHNFIISHLLVYCQQQIIVTVISQGFATQTRFAYGVKD